MMRKTNSKIFLLIIFVFCAFLCIIVNHWIESNESNLTMHLETAMENYLDGNTSVIDVASIDFFEWDRVYIFNVYESCATIVEIIGAPFYWFRCKSTGIQHNELIVLFVFMKNDVVVGTATPSNYTVGNFLTRKEILVADAYFVLNDHGNLEIVAR
jgi:hypothetical protein